MGLLESGRVRRLWVFDYPRNHAYPWFIELLPNIASKVSRINDARRVASHRYAKFFPPSLALALATRASLSWNKGYFYFFIYFSLLVYLFIYLFTYFLVGIFLVRIEKFSLFEKNLTETSHSDERKNKKRENYSFDQASSIIFIFERSLRSGRAFRFEERNENAEMERKGKAKNGVRKFSCASLLLALSSSLAFSLPIN